MLTISHRGNVNGADQHLENNPEHIKNLLKSDIQVEIDVWFKDTLIMLGHDNPQYIVNNNFLKQNGLWCHAKNLEALHFMLKKNIKHCFWHQVDDFTITSSKYIWTYPDKNITNRSIIVDTSKEWKSKNYNCWAVCVDYI